MDYEKLKDTLNKVKFCIRNELPVLIRAPAVHGIYVPDELRMRKERNGRSLYYTILVRDPHGISSVLTVGLEDSDWKPLTRMEVYAIEKSEQERSCKDRKG